MDIIIAVLLSHRSCRYLELQLPAVQPSAEGFLSRTGLPFKKTETRLKSLQKRRAAALYAWLP